MPYCPECRYEYRPAVERCPDCDTELVDRLPEAKPKFIDEGLVCVARYPFEEPAQTARLKLESYGIQAVLENEIMSQTDLILVFADGGVRLMVREGEAETARKVLESE